MKSAEHWIRALDLARHPEGGYFRETYRSEESLTAESLPDRFGGQRSLATSAYYLLAGDEFSAFHRLKSDEVWHHYAGHELTVHVITRNGEHLALHLGRSPENGRPPQIVVPRGNWMAAELDTPGTFALLGCTVAPGFEFADFELGHRTELCRLYPQHRGLIEALTRS